MGKAVSRGQALQVSARVATQVNWDELDGDQLQSEVIDLTSEEFGRRFTNFLKNGARVIVGEPKAIKIDCSKPFDPVSFIGERWSIWKGPIDGNGLQGDEEQDERSLALTELDITKIQFKTMLKDNEFFIKGEEVLRRLKDTDYIRLGGNVFYALWQDYQKNNENSALEWLRRTCDINYSDFFGLVLRDPDGYRGVLYLCWGGGRWRWYYRWLGNDWHVSYPSALLASS